MTVPLESIALKMTYKSKGKVNPAIKDFSFSVKNNSIFSILGRNGSGKTTFVKISTTQLRPDSGSIKIFGRDVVEEDQEVRKIISLVPQESRPFPFLTPWEHVYYFQKMHGNTREGSKERAQFVMDLLDMESFCDTECVNLSGGQKQLTMVAMAFSLYSQIYFLDEPTIGLDIITRKRVWEAIMGVKKKGKTIILTTHYLDEAAYLSDEICVVSRGKLAKQGTLDELRSSLKHDTRIIIRDSDSRDKLAKYGKVTHDNRGTVLYTDHDAVESILSDKSIRKDKLELGPVGLDDVFISLVGETIEVDEN